MRVINPSTLYVHPVNVPEVLMVIAVEALHRISSVVLGYGTAPEALIVAVVKAPVAIRTIGIVIVRAVLPSSVQSTCNENASALLVVTRMLPFTK